MFLGACSFGMLSTIVKHAYAEGYSVGEITGSQAFWGAVMLWIFLLFRMNRKKEVETKKTAWWKPMLLGLSNAVVSVTYYQAVNLLPASIAIILLMQYLWISVLFEYLLFKKKPDKIQSISVIIVLIGTCFAGGLFGEEINTLNSKGVLLGFVAAMAYAGVILVSGRYANDLLPELKSALIVTGSCLLIFIVYPPVYLISGDWYLLKWVLPLALFGMVIPPLFFAYGVPKAGVGLSAVLSAAELPVAVILSYTILKESVTFLQWLGVLLILSAMILPYTRSTN